MLKATEVIATLESEEEALGEKSVELAPRVWRMDGGVRPSKPYAGFTFNLKEVEENMAVRNQRLISALEENEFPLSIVSFPTLGAGGNFTTPPAQPGGPMSLSEGVPDAVINHIPASPV